MLNSYDITKQSIVYGMFNQYVFSEVKNNIDLIEKYFMTDPSTMTNTLIRDLIEAIRRYDLQYIDEPLFRSILANQGKTDQESNEILGEIIKYKRFDTDQIDPIRKFIRGIGSQSLINAAAKIFPNDPEGYIKYLRNHEYKADMSDVFTTLNFDQLDINSIQASSFSGWPSSYRFINDSFQPYCKYENGQIVMIVAPPGCFTGDTLISLSDGSSISIKDMSDGVSRGEKYEVKCTRFNGSVSVTKVKDCWMTKRTRYLTKLTVLTDGIEKVIKCTPDHKIMMSDLRYKMAIHLKKGDKVRSEGRNGFSLVVSSEAYINPEPIEVYDIEVYDRCHNFQLADSKIFVHNCGKTLFMMSECLNMTIAGARTHYLALGDMNQKDFVQRMGAMYSGMSFSDTLININRIYPNLRGALQGRFNLSILPAATVTIDEYIEYMMERIHDIDVMFVDYDSNFKVPSSDNMYKEGGYLYDNLTKLTQMGKLVFIASQPKIGTWCNEVLDLPDAGESSRKQHRVLCHSMETYYENSLN